MNSYHLNYLERRTTHYKGQLISSEKGLDIDLQRTNCWSLKKRSTTSIYVQVSVFYIDGIEFFRSANGVILTPGNSDGFLLPCYFEKVVQL